MTNVTTNIQTVKMTFLNPYNNNLISRTTKESRFDGEIEIRRCATFTDGAEIHMITVDQWGGSFDITHSCTCDSDNCTHIATYNQFIDRAGANEPTVTTNDDTPPPTAPTPETSPSAPTCGRCGTPTDHNNNCPNCDWELVALDAMSAKETAPAASPSPTSTFAPSGDQTPSASYQSRHTKAVALVESDVITFDDNVALVDGTADTYIVRNGTCTCPDFTHRGATHDGQKHCKHTIAVALKLSAENHQTSATASTPSGNYMSRNFAAGIITDTEHAAPITAAEIAVHGNPNARTITLEYSNEIISQQPFAAGRGIETIICVATCEEDDCQVRNRICESNAGRVETLHCTCNRVHCDHIKMVTRGQTELTTSCPRPTRIFKETTADPFICQVIPGRPERLRINLHAYLIDSPNAAIRSPHDATAHLRPFDSTIRRGRPDSSAYTDEQFDEQFPDDADFWLTKMDMMNKMGEITI